MTTIAPPCEHSDAALACGRDELDPFRAVPVDRVEAILARAHEELDRRRAMPVDPIEAILARGHEELERLRAGAATGPSASGRRITRSLRPVDALVVAGIPTLLAPIGPVAVALAAAVVVVVAVNVAGRHPVGHAAARGPAAASLLGSVQLMVAASPSGDLRPVVVGVPVLAAVLLHRRHLGLRAPSRRATLLLAVAGLAVALAGSMLLGPVPGVGLALAPAAAAGAVDVVRQVLHR